MMRYLFIIYPEIYDYHFNKINQGNALKMETWIDDFDQNANKILNVLNFNDTEQNRNKLKLNGIRDVNISQERDLLLKEIFSISEQV